MLFGVRGACLNFTGFGNGGHSRRMPGTVVAGVTGHHLMPVEVVLVNSEHHCHHFTRPLLGLLGVFVKVVFYVAEVTMHTE
jgi:hypothetical protein